jgi:L-lysine 2,3-aminomutase
MSKKDKDPMLAPYYTADLTITITNIDAKSKKQAEKIMNKFIDKIAPIMDSKIRWDEANWEVQKNVYIPEYEEWHQK